MQPHPHRPHPRVNVGARQRRQIAARPNAPPLERRQPIATRRARSDDRPRADSAERTSDAVGARDGGWRDPIVPPATPGRNASWRRPSDPAVRRATAPSYWHGPTLRSSSNTVPATPPASSATPHGRRPQHHRQARPRMRQHPRRRHRVGHGHARRHARARPPCAGPRARSPLAGRTRATTRSASNSTASSPWGATRGEHARATDSSTPAGTLAPVDSARRQQIIGRHELRQSGLSHGRTRRPGDLDAWRPGDRNLSRRRCAR